MAKFTNEEESSWITISDLMAGLMVVFLFIAVAYMIDVNKKQATISEIIQNYNKSKKAIADNLKKDLGNDFKKWGAELDEATLTIRFSGEKTKFDPSRDQLSQGFIAVLNEFIPKYLEVVSRRDILDNIQELRIEGHAYKSDEGFQTIFKGSQNRAMNVLMFVRDHPHFKILRPEIKRELEFRLTATGMGSERMIDDEDNFVYKTNRRACDVCSRRVEFTILTKSEKVIENLLDTI